jgi:hypothetical protein
MTDYTKTTDFAAKDGLPSGDSGKIIKGLEFETEFDNIATAIATKSNIASPTFTGTTTIPTVDINGGAIDAVTLGTNSAVTEAQVDNININGNTISSSDTDGNVNISPNGTGTVVINTDLDVDNINVNGNAIISTDTNGNIDLTPNGTGEVNISKVDIDSGAIDGTVIGAASAAAITGTTITGTSFVTSGDMTFGDNDKAVFGAGSDLQIYHNASDSIINDNGTGSLKLQQGGSTKLEVTTTGIDVTGTVTADGLTVDGDVSVSTSSSTTDGTDGAFVDIKNTNTTTSVVSGVRFLNGTTTAFKGAVFFEDLAGDGRGDVVIASNDVASGSAAVGLADQRLRVSRSGDISFYEDTGTTPKFVWKAADERLGIGTASPSTALTVSGAFNATTAGSKPSITGAGNYGGGIGFIDTNVSGMYTDSSGGNLKFFTNQSGSDTAASKVAMTINSSGNVGIGTTSPNNRIDAVEAQDTVANVLANGTYVAKFTGDTTYTTGASQGVLIGGVDGSLRGVALVAEAQSVLNDHNFIIAVSGTSATPTERMRIDSSGNVGIGTSSPSAKLDTAYTDSATYSATTPSADLILSRKNTANTNNQTVGIRFDVTGWSGSTTGGAAIEAIQPSSASTADLAFLTRNAGTWGERMRIDSSGNLLVGTTARPTSSAGNIVLANGTAPTASATDGVILYAEDVSSSSELKVRDEAGNITTLSPHNFDLIPQGPSEDMAWSYYSERDGKQINVDMLKAIRVLEKLSGEQLVFEN